jgi:syntaxin 16
MRYGLVGTEIKGLEVRNQDLLAASGALPLKDSYAALNDDVELVSPCSEWDRPSQRLPNQTEFRLTTRWVTQSNRELQSQSLLLREEESSSRQATTNLLSQRDREITGIAQSISELADLFKDLSNMVIDQGTMLDRIDYNIEKVSEEMREAVKELDVATQ